MSTSTILNKRRLVVLLLGASIAFFALIVRIGWIQIVKGEEYRQMAHIQQTRDIPIPAKRGIIYDRNRKELAISASTHTVWARLAEVQKMNKDESEEDIKRRINDMALKLADVLKLDKQDLINMLSKKKVGLIRIKKWIEKDQADAIRKEKMPGIEVAEDNRRYYPFGNFAAHVIGHTTVDNQGLVGIERQYDKYLSGLPGRWIKNTDAAGRQLHYGEEKYYQAKNGLNVVLTIDEVIQHFAEKAIEDVLAKTQAKRVMAIVMDPKTGDILSMAKKPDYDPNDARVPVDENQKREYEAADIKKKQKMWNEMWRNPLVSDTYEPGSTFKLITAASGLEEGVVTPESPFYSKGYIMVAGRRIKCWRYYRPHGQESFTQALGNSCNPVFVEVGQRLGTDKLYQYIEGFGFTQKTGIGLPGEGNAIVQNKKRVGPVELATISFGQGISVTPIQLITAVSGIGNDGKVMEPHIVKELVDDSNNVVHKYEPKILRQVISQKTARELRLMMEKVVTEGAGKNAYLPGFRIGGKTGTAQKAINGRYADGKYYASFISLAPVDDPKIAVLVVVDEPQGAAHGGGSTSAPAVREIIQNTFRYLDIDPKYNDEEAKEYEKKETSVPEVRNKTLKEATKILEGRNLQYQTEPYDIEDGKYVVVDQFPKPGAKVSEKAIVILYVNKENSD